MPTHRTRLVVAAAALAVALPAHAAVHIGWVRGAGYAEQHRRPSKYWPGHLFDGNRRTVTCFAGGSKGATAAHITIGLKGQGKITGVRIDNGDGRSKRDAKAHNRVQGLVIQDASMSRTVTLPDTTKPQVVRLGDPIQGDKVTLTIKSVYGTGRLTCLSNVTFLEGRRPLVVRHLRYRRRRAALEGLWAAGPKGAPERFLALYLDGRYLWTYAPNDPSQKGTHFAGRWTVAGHRLRLERYGRWLTLHYRLRGKTGTHGALHLTGSRRLPKHLAGHYRDHWL